MEDVNKPKQQLLEELNALRLRLEVLERDTVTPVEDEQLFHQVMEASPFPMILSSKDRQTVLINRKFEKIFGLNHHDAYDINTLWSLASPEEDIGQAGNNKWCNYVQAAMEKKGDIEPMEGTVKCWDGSIRYIECRLVSIGSRNLIVCNDLTDFKRTQEQLTRANERLKVWVCELELHNQRLNFLHQMGSALQACHHDEEAYSVIRHFGPLLFPKTRGVLYELDNTQATLKATAGWGKDIQIGRTFSTESCCAFKTGRLHSAPRDTQQCTCPIKKNCKTVPFICAPMSVAEEQQGIFHLTMPESREYAEGAIELALVVTEYMALSLANLRLRERLRTQAIRDPLTGLFNRRYMEESLEQEFYRANRRLCPVSIIMLDIDHFKMVNDQYGHDAGDALLKNLGIIIQNLVRKEDIACRFGGEEFIMILPDTPLDVAVQRADYFRSELKCNAFLHNGRNIGLITVSMGVATYPNHGRSVEAIIRMADEALYRAKENGRNRVEKALPHGLPLREDEKLNDEVCRSAT